MDWAKAKNILIAALLITNLILLGAIYTSMDHDGDEGDVIKEDTILLLQDHQIYVEEEQIPDQSQRMPVLSVRYRTADEKEVKRSIEESEAIAPDASDDQYRQAADHLLREAGISYEDLVYREVKRGEETVSVVYGVEYKGYSLDNACLKVVFREGRPDTIGANWAEAVTMGRNKKQVMTASTALIKFMTELEAEGEDQPREDIFIEEIRLVYWLEGYTEDGGVSEDTAVPYWCIQYNEGQRSYIAAYEQ